MRIKTARPLTVTAVLALTLSACGGGGDSNGGTPGEGGGGELSVAWNANPPTLDPLVTTSTATRDISRHFFEPLITIDGDGEIQPVLAEDWEVSEDGLDIVFTLREGVLFHDGTEMEAEDVVASLQRWIDESNIGQSYFTEAEVNGEGNTVTVTLEEPMYVAPQLLADQAQLPMIMPAEIAESAPPEGLEEYVGTGPYEMATWQVDQYVELERFEDYESPEGEPNGTAGEKNPYYDTIMMEIINDSSTRLSGLQTGEYDIVYSVPFDNMAQLEDDDSVEVIAAESGPLQAYFNKAEGPMSELPMRQAVVAAMNANDIMISAYAEEQYYTTNGALMPEDSVWYSDANMEIRDESGPEDVEAFLEEADYDGETIRIITTQEYDHIYQSSVMLQEQLNEAGINTELNVYDWPTVLQDRENPEAYDIFITGFTPVAVPVTFVFLHPTWAGWTDDEDIQAAIDTVTSAEDEEGALEGAQDLQVAYYDYLPAAKFGEATSTVGYQAELEGIDFAPISGVHFWNVRPAED
ncbi:hypothetical protein HGQ17_10800 [Nesterenkonia sp. MY13]|uniref:Solute-binding protein family 5 domain-containing protein n=1 Tax=Nesterenkonia sedimenti TaxID=1463632 RepID=A0A7X8TKY3_9MICC|nr:ABC transporter substrate-binding protein [Nesterenkonia sedimenti]NLS10469.1 hypothetical protein [Nesterenkonia sedimenti]